MMTDQKIYCIEVPYQEKVYGTVYYQIGANSEEEAKEIFNSGDSYQYYWDTEQDGSIDYEEFTDEAKVSLAPQSVQDFLNATRNS